MASADFDRTRVEMVLTELDLVTTFLRIARTSPKVETRRRNRKHAWEAYTMAHRYWLQVPASREITRAVEERFAEATEQLQATGENGR